MINGLEESGDVETEYFYKRSLGKSKVTILELRTYMTEVRLLPNFFLMICHLDSASVRRTAVRWR